MAERSLPPFEKTEILQKVGAGLKPVLNQSLNLVEGKEIPDYIPENGSRLFIDRISWTLVKERYPMLAATSDQFVARLSAAHIIGQHLCKPRTIQEYQELKYSALSFTFYLNSYDITSLYYSGDKLLKYGFGNKTKDDVDMPLTETVGIFIDMADKTKVLQKERLKTERITAASAEQVWRRIEETNRWDPQRCVVHESLPKLSQSLDELRYRNYRKTFIPRIGLVFGDFRVGFHPGHAQLVENARSALGKDGRLVVVTPTKRVIQNTNRKQNVWDDEIRTALIAINPNVNDLLVSDVSEEFWDNPTQHWGKVWKEINPDLVFLGEVNHPLEPKYREQASNLGGILLIDDSIRSNLRSGSLLEM